MRLRVVVRKFAAYIEQTAGDELDALADELAGGDAPPTAMLCWEADPATCHRVVLAEALVERRPEITVVDLG